MTRPQVTVSQSNNNELEDLKNAFDAFYQRRAPYERIPFQLRQLAITAHHQGIPMGVICRACRISSQQFQLWLHRVTPPDGPSTPNTDGIRILNVEPDSQNPPSKHKQPGFQVNMQLGTYSLHLSLGTPKP